eukprot:5846031-Prymnesium_polylepis.2
MSCSHALPQVGFLAPPTAARGRDGAWRAQRVDGASRVERRAAERRRGAPALLTPVRALPGRRARPAAGRAHGGRGAARAAAAARAGQRPHGVEHGVGRGAVGAAARRRARTRGAAVRAAR